MVIDGAIELAYGRFCSESHGVALPDPNPDDLLFIRMSTKMRMKIITRSLILII